MRPAIPGARLAARLFGGDAGVLLLARLVQNASGFLLSIITLREFGLAGMGSATLATVAISTLALLCGFGLPSTLARDSMSIPQRNMLGLAASLLAVPLMLPAIALYALLVAHGQDEALAIAALVLGGFFFAHGNILTALLVLQGRAGLALALPLASLAALGIAAWLASSLAGFALILAALRLLATAGVYARLELAPLPPRAVLERLRRGIGFLSTEAINLGSDQLGVLIVSWLIPREALGVLGLCRQFLTVAETPSWSLGQANYPNLVAEPGSTFARLWPTSLQLALLCAIGTLLGGWALGTFVYAMPALTPLLAVLLLALPLRYQGNLYEQALRAMGAVGLCNRLALTRLALGLGLLGAGAALGGLWGVVAGTVLLALLGFLLARRAAGPLLAGAQGTPAALRPNPGLPALLPGVR